MTAVSSADSFEEKYLRELEKHMELKVLGEANQILGVEINQKDGKIFINQKSYIKNLLKLYEMMDSNEVNAPMDTNQKLDEDEGSPLCDQKIYQELLGRLMYLSVATRPDITYGLSLSQFRYGRTNTIKGIRCETDASWDSTRDAVI